MKYVHTVTKAFYDEDECEFKFYYNPEIYSSKRKALGACYHEYEIHEGFDLQIEKVYDNVFFFTFKHYEGDFVSPIKVRYTVRLDIMLDHSPKKYHIGLKDFLNKQYSL